MSLIVRAGIAGAASLLAVIGFLLWQNSGLRADLIVLEKRNSEVIAANAAQKSAMNALLAQVKRNNAATTKAAKKILEASARARHLEHQLRKAINEQKYSDFQYSRDVSHALCLRWLNAEDRLPGDYATNGLGSHLDRRNDPLAAFCAAWPQLTAEGAATYIGDLIDYAGRQKARASSAREGEAMP